MDITINHYEPEAYKPYDIEIYENITDFQYDTSDRRIRFITSDGKIYTAQYNHHILIDIQTR